MPSTARKTQTRYNLVLPEHLHTRLQEVADRKEIAIQELVRKFLRLGLIAVEVEDTPGSELIIREGGVERRIMII